MYAIIRTGGKQAKVREGDVLDVELLRGDGDVEFTPLLVVGEDGAVMSDRDTLAASRVVAEIVGPSAGPKVDIFKYKNKTGYRNRQGHRQKYTRIKVARIEVAGATPADKPKAKADEPKAKADEPKVKADEPKVKAEEPKAKAEEPKAKAEEPKAKADEPKAEKPAAKADKPAAKKADANETAAKAEPEAVAPAADSDADADQEA